MPRTAVRLGIYLPRRAHTHTCTHRKATCKQIPTIVLPPVHNLACVCFPAFFHRVEIFSPDETCIYLGFFFLPRPQPPKSNKRGSSILFFFLHKTPSRGMLVIHVNSSIMPCSSHYQPCCSYYASTSSALIKMNALRYHFMFPRFAYCLPKHRTQVRCTEPICCMVVVQ